MRLARNLIVICVLVFSAALPALAPQVARAADPFTLTASGGGTNVSVSSNNVTDLAGNLINSENQFLTLANKNVTGTLRYGGLNNAVLFTRNAAGTSASITIPSTGFSKTFTATNENDLQNQIEDFFKKNGATEYARFLRSINEGTTIGVTDGNPLAVTALMADASFTRFGFLSPRWEQPESPPLGRGFDLRLNGGESNSDDADGWYADLGIGNLFPIGDRFGISLNFDFRYRDVEGAAVYEVVNTDGFPIRIIKPSNPGDNGLSWTVTPAFVIGFGDSWDLAAGGLPIGGQVTSQLAVRAGGWVFVLANQYGYYGSTGINVSDFRFETDVDQQILKNGVQVIREFGRAFVDAGVSYTNFLKDAAVDSYWSPEVGAGLRFGAGSGVRVGYHGDFGTGFNDNGGNVELFISY